jgi:type IV pilus assembly protein PilN
MKNPFANLLKKKTDDTPGITPPKSNTKKESFLSKFFKSRLGKSSAIGEEIVGVDFSFNEIRLAQITSDKSNQWILQKFYAHKFEGISDNENILDHPDKVADELKIALQKGKFDTSNAAIAIPVTSAIIRVVTSPLMTDEELNNAVKTDSL